MSDVLKKPDAPEKSNVGPTAPGLSYDPFQPQYQEIVKANSDRIQARGFQGLAAGAAFGLLWAVCARFGPGFPKSKFNQFAAINTAFWGGLIGLVGAGYEGREVLEDIDYYKKYGEKSDNLIIPLKQDFWKE